MRLKRLQDNRIIKVGDVMDDDEKKGNSGISVGGNFSMTGGAMAFGKNAKAVNTINNANPALVTELLNAMMSLRTGFEAVPLSEKGREVVNKKLDKLESSVKALKSDDAVAVLDDLTDTLAMVDVAPANMPHITEPLEVLRRWGSGARSDNTPPHR
jgi:hypothetical protein